MTEHWAERCRGHLADSVFCSMPTGHGGRHTTMHEGDHVEWGPLYDPYIAGPGYLGYVRTVAELREAIASLPDTMRIELPAVLLLRPDPAHGDLRVGVEPDDGYDRGES